MDQSSVSVFSMGVPVSAKQVSADSFLDGARTLRRGVLDVLRLVEEDAGKAALRVEVDVALERVVRRHDDVDAARLLEQSAALRFDPATATA